MPLTSSALGSNLASRAILLDPPGNMGPSDAVSNAAMSNPMATETAATVKVATATIANAVMERQADMTSDQGDLREPMHVKGA